MSAPPSSSGGAATSTAPAVGKSSSSPISVSSEYTKVESPRIENSRADPERVHYGNWVPNPQSKAAGTGQGSTCGCSNAVTPIPAYLPSMQDMGWAIGIVAAIKSLLDDGPSNKYSESVSYANQVIDNNDYLPTTAELSEFTNRVVGTT